jgi:hypothetical protein
VVGSLAAGIAAVAAVGAARAWEPTTTNAGLTESAALSSGLHRRLESAYGLELGLYAPLTVAKQAGGALYKRLGQLEPSEGYVPDKRGRQSALAWLTAGAVLEEIPGFRSRHHFYDPVHKTGLSGEGLGGLGRFVERRLWARAGGGEQKRIAAPDWIGAKENELGLDRFHTELALAVAAPDKIEREQHLAMALLCAGAMTAVLEDVGSPSRARDDLGEHLLPLGGGDGDRGSRFEHLAAVAYGRIGVPAPARTVTRIKARDFFTAADGQGLADLTAKRWYSSGTLPGRVQVRTRPAAGEVPERVAEAQRFAEPRPTAELDLEGAATDRGAVLRNAEGTCLARYFFEGSWLAFAIDDACAAEQLAQILPEVAAFATGFLDFLFRGALSVDATGQVTVTGVGLGAGTLSWFIEDAAGVRKRLADKSVKSAGAGVRVTGSAPPAGAKRIVVLFTGVDAFGETIVAAGVRTL